MRRAKPYGKIELGSLVLIAAIVGFVYSAWVFSTPVLDNLDVKEAIDMALNQSRRSDHDLQRLILNRLSRVGTHQAVDDFGNEVEEQGLGLTEENVYVERDEVAGTLLIRVSYDRVVQLKPSQHTYTLSFSPEKEGPISR
ncbi:MAG: hypothetical protein WBV82_33660 [Myxococcaceae bacterium]